MMVIAAADPPAGKGGAPVEAAADSATRAPWVGLRISKLTRAMEAQLPGIPQGIGFLVDSVDDGGPADAAGIRSYDVVWKLGDQMLVNEAQFATLLMMGAPGDRLEFTLRRCGEDLVVPVELASSPEADEAQDLPPAEVPLVPTGVPGMPRTIVYPQARTAETSREDGGVARLHYEDDKPVVSIHDVDGELVYEGPVWDDGDFQVPKDWACNVGALMRVMRHSEKSDWKPRKPRPRVVTGDDDERRDSRDRDRDDEDERDRDGRRDRED